MKVPRAGRSARWSSSADVDLLRGVGGWLCHQDPARSWAPGGQLLVVCQRCAGLYLGLLAAILILAAVGAPRRRIDVALHLAGLLHLPLLVLLRVPHGAIARTASGFVFSVSAAFLLEVITTAGHGSARPARYYAVLALAGWVMVRICASSHLVPAAAIDVAIGVGMLALPWLGLRSVVRLRS